MDDSYSLATPEQVELSYDVAGLGSRFLALLLESLIQLAVLVAKHAPDVRTVLMPGLWNEAAAGQLGRAMLLDLNLATLDIAGGALRCAFRITLSNYPTGTLIATATRAGTVRNISSLKEAEDALREAVTSG